MSALWKPSTPDLATHSAKVVLDAVRSAQALGGDLPEWAMIRENDPVEVRIHGETRLLGHVDDIQLEMADGEIRATVSGRDRTGDLVDCSANPTGPGEYRAVHLVDVIGKLTGPFGLAVSADVDTGDPFTLVARGRSGQTRHVNHRKAVAPARGSGHV